MDQDPWRSDRTGTAGPGSPGSSGAAGSPTRVSVPDSVRFALWFTAWCRGAASLDEARDAIVGGDAAHDIAGLPGAEEPMPLILALGVLRGRGAQSAGCAFPAPGDPLGLAGPPAFNGEALEHAEAVVLDRVDLGLVPVRAGAGVVWRCLRASSVREVPDLAEADRALRRALPAAADTLADLDVVAWRREAADELSEQLAGLRSSVTLPVPPDLAPAASRLLAIALRCRRIVDLALEDDGGAVTAREADARRAALRPLDQAARRALVAVCGAETPPDLDRGAG